MTTDAKIKKTLLTGYNNYDKLAKKYGVSRQKVMKLNYELGSFTPPPRNGMRDRDFWNPESELKDFRIEIDHEGVKHIYQSKMN